MRSSFRTIAVGIFTLIVIIASGLAIFFLSPEIFKEKYVLYTYMKDVIGLTEGSHVRLSGRFVGTMNGMELIEIDGDPYWKLQLVVQKRVQDKIREDSIASSKTQGLLGKKYINISLGGQGKRILTDGDDIEGQDSLDLSKQIAKAEETLTNINVIAQDVAALLKDIRASGLIESLGETMKNIAVTTRAINEGEGLVHQLLYAPVEGNVSQQIHDIIADIEGILSQVREGDGLAHALLYEEEGKQTLANIDESTASVKRMLAEFEQGQVMEKEDRTRLIDNLMSVSDSLKSVVARIQSGEGTLGALLEDPTVYQDLKTLLGGAQRSTLLRGVIRYAISQQEQPPAP